MSSSCSTVINICAHPLWLILILIFYPLYTTTNAQQEETIYFFSFEDPYDWSLDEGSFNSSLHTFKPITWYNWDGDYKNCPRSNAGDISLGSVSCLRLFMDSSISRIISTVGYHSIHLQIDVNPQSVEHPDDEWCFVAYRTATTNWINANIVNGHDTPVLDFDITIPDDSTYNNQSSFEVRIGIDANTGGDSCLFDNLKVFGVPYVTLSGVTVHLDDYKSHSNLSLHCIKTCQIDAAFAGQSISFVKSDYKIECDGDHACANAGVLQAPKEIDCDGSNSCSFTIINKTTTLRCDGDRACENTYISGAERVYGKGAYSLLNATIDSMDSPSLRVYLWGYHSGFSATVICQSNHSCTITCAVNSCHNLYANCVGDCSFKMYKNVSFMPITNASLFNAIALRSFYNSHQITSENDMECNNEISLTVDEWDDWDDGNETFIYANTTLCCRGSKSCVIEEDIWRANYTITVQSSLDMNCKLICSGREACYRAEIHNYMGSIFCSGEEACERSHINTTRAVYCFASQSCDKSYIYNTQFLVCAAWSSCTDSYIYSSGLTQVHHFYFLGDQSAENTQIYCQANDECVVFCGGLEACLNTTIHCQSGCKYTIECLGDVCPVVRMHMSTAMPTTQHPTKSTITLPPTSTRYSTMSPVLNQTPGSNNSTIVFGMILIGCVMVMPLIVIVFACLFHRKRTGSDRPGYVSLLRFFGGIVDWYTDVLWAYALHIEGHSLWIPAFVCVFGSHFVSIITCIFWITKWRQNRRQIHIAEYANRYDRFVIALSVISGFYGATALITSHLFHLRVLSLCLDSAELSSISTMKILNESLLENIPVLVIQIIYLNSIHKDNSNFITLIAMFFTIISIVVMAVTLVERFINHVVDRAHTSTPDDDLNEIHLEFILQSVEKRTIKQYHIHTQFLLTEAIRTVFEIERSQVKINRIQKVIHGIKIHTDLMLLQDEEAHNIMDSLQDNDDRNNENPLYCALLNECIDRLGIHLGSITLNIVQIEFRSEININQETPMLANIEMQQDWTTLNDDTAQHHTEIN